MLEIILGVSRSYSNIKVLVVKVTQMLHSYCTDTSLSVDF
jgi:hypothetical protein